MSMRLLDLEEGELSRYWSSKRRFQTLVRIVSLMLIYVRGMLGLSSCYRSLKSLIFYVRIYLPIISKRILLTVILF